jgi:hypothetical protein
MVERKGKLIHVSCWGPIAFSNKYKSPWEDVWISWTGKPGRTKYRLAPCLISLTDLKDNIELTQTLQKENPDIDWSDEIEELTNAFENTFLGNIFVANPKDKLTNIYTPMEFITREEANNMIRELMKFYNFDKIRIKWSRPKMLVIPV